MKEKIKVLAIPIDRYGCGCFRIIIPYKALSVAYPEEFDVLVVDTATEELLKWADVVCIQRILLNSPSAHLALVQWCLKEGKALIWDIDDLEWIIPTYHPSYRIYKSNNLEKHIIEIAGEARFITTTTPNLASELSRIKSKDSVLYVQRNCLDLNHQQWRAKKKPEEDGVVRLGWAGGSSHLSDLKDFRGVAQQVNLSVKENVHMYVCGYDTRGSVEVSDEFGNRYSRKLLPEEAVWNEMVDLLGGGLPKDNIKIIPTRDINSYGLHFTLFDVGIVPVRAGRFERCKSELKLLELGAYNIPAVVSENCAYPDVIEQGVNGFLVRERKKHKEWFNFVKRLVVDKELRLDLGKSIGETIRKNYNIWVKVEERAELVREVYHLSGKSGA